MTYPTSREPGAWVAGLPVGEGGTSLEAWVGGGLKYFIFFMI